MGSGNEIGAKSVGCKIDDMRSRLCFFSREKKIVKIIRIWRGGSLGNLVSRAHVPFGQHQDTELWNNQFPKTKILGLPASWRMRDLAYLASRDKTSMWIRSTKAFKTHWKD